MSGDTGLLILIVLPALVGAGLALIRPSRGARTISLIAATTVLVLAVLTATLRPEADVDFMAGARLGLEVDGPAVLFVPTIAAVTLLVLAFAAADPRSHPGDGAGAPARFHGLMLLFAAAALMTATAATLPTLLMGWEVMGATSYALIGFGWREQHRVSSGLVAFVTTRTADLGLYVAAGAALAGGAGWALTDLDQATPGWRHVIAAGLAVAALGKAAQLPVSFWLSRAMDGPSPVSALLHSAAMVALGGFVLLRAAPLLAATGWADQAVAWVGALTAVALGAVAVA
jgi:NADH-quinone oxidoreductase subunit L